MEPEQKLYINVIIQILEDYIKPNPTAANKGESLIAKREAIAWFKYPTTGLVAVCEFANVDAYWLRNLVLNAEPPYRELRAIIDEYRAFI